MLRKRLLLAVFLLAVTASVACAQSAAGARGLHASLSGGVNNVYIVNQNNYGLSELDYEVIFRPGFGLKGGYQLSQSFGLRTGLLYTQRGQHYDDSDLNVQKEVDLRYLSVPLLLDLRVGAAGQGFYFQIGPQISFLLSADVSAQGQSAPPVNGRDDEDLYRGTDYGVVFELGPYIGLSQRSYLTVGLRGLYGLTDINAEEVRIDPPGEDYEASRNAYVGLHLSLHYVFPTGR